MPKRARFYDSIENVTVFELVEYFLCVALARLSNMRDTDE